MVTEQIQRSTGSKIKRFFVKAAIGLTAIYGAGVAIDYHFTNDKVKDQISTAKTIEIGYLLKNDTVNYSLEKKVQTGLEQEQKKILFSHSAKWFYSPMKSVYHVGQDLFEKKDTTTLKTHQ